MTNRQGIGFWAAVALVSAAGFVRADCVPTTTPISQSGVFPGRMAEAVATNGSVLALTKIDPSQTSNAIYAATFSSAFSQLTADVTAAPASLAGPAALLWNGSEFALFYQAPSLALTLQRIDTSGNLAGGPIAFSNHIWSPGDEFDVTWVAARNAYAVERTVTNGADRGLWLTFFSPSGAVELDTNLTAFFNSPAHPRVAALADGTVDAVWSRTGDNPLVAVFAAAPNGSMTVIPVSQQTVTDLRVASNGAATLIVDSVPATGGGTTLRYAEVGATSVIAPDAPFFSGSGIDIVPRTVIWNPALSEWALVYTDAAAGLTSDLPGDTRFRRFASPTGLFSDTLLSPNRFYSQLLAPFPPVFLNGAYIDSIARVLSPPEGSESYLVKDCPFFVTAKADRPVASPFVAITFTAVPSGGLPGYTYAWDFGDLDSEPGGPVVQHAYRIPGTYTVTVTGKDGTGAQSVFKFTVTVVNLRHRAVR